MSAATAAPPIPVKSKLRQKSFSIASPKEDQAPRSRFVEQFDMIPPPELLDALQETDLHVAITRKPTKPNTGSKPLLPFLSSPSSSSALSAAYKTHAPADQPTPSLSAGENRSPQLKHSTSFWSTPSMKRSASTRSRKEDRSSSGGGANNHNNVESSRVSVAKSTATKINTLISLNRAEVIITRLEDWQALLKAVIGWLEEVAKIHFQCSRGYSQRTLPIVKRDSENEEKDAMATILAGLQLLSLNVAEQHKEFGKHVQLDLLPSLQKLRKDCKEMIKSLKEDPHLLMDELLRLAETTRKTMSTLNKHCKAIESDKHIEHDPMMSNLFVLRHLKREVDEENRMRELMVPIQKGTIAFEKRVIDQLKVALAYCYEFLAPKLWDGGSPSFSSSSSSASVDVEEEEVAPYKLVLEQLMPEYEWNSFYERKKKDLVDEDNPKKDYLKINYPNKMSPYVMTVAKGVLERRAGVLKQFVERYYILSQCGFLHEFVLNDKVSPERSIYVPDCEVFSTYMESGNRRTTTHDDSHYTFEIHKKGTQVLQRDRVYIFRANSHEELKSWYRSLLQASTGTLPLPQQQQQQQQQKHQQQQQLIAPPRSIARSQHSNNSTASIGQTPLSTPSIPSRHSRPSLVGDEDMNGSGSTRSSIMTAKPPTAAAAAEEDDHAAVDFDNERKSGDGEKGAREEKHNDKVKDDERPNDGGEQEDMVNDVVKEYTFTGTLAEAPRLETPRTSALFDDSESSVYFSSTSAPPSPTSAVSDDHNLEEIAIPTLEEDLPTTPRVFNVPRGDFYTPVLNHR